MSRIRVRTPAGHELTFASREELSSASLRGEVRADWKVYHERRRQWLPVTMHPAFRDRAGAESFAQARRSSELVLIYPDQELTSRRSPVVEDVLDRGPLLTQEEIDRALNSGSRWPKVELPGGICRDQLGEPLVTPLPGERSGDSHGGPSPMGKVLPTITRAVSGVVSLGSKRR
ncbi:MAG TPA: hypothetical protein VNJ71_01000 [Gemmatimonadales bacterium]|nr:hypothetical protein [Gemmatimonadales bacterium]